MPHEVRISDPDVVDDLVAALNLAHVGATRKNGRTVVVASSTNGDETTIELVFFLRAWASSHPGVRIDVSVAR